MPGARRSRACRGFGRGMPQPCSLAAGGGTTLDVGKSVAALARQEGGGDVAAFQLGQRQVVAERVLPWVAVPTTSGTGSESTDNAVIELGEEKRSIRGIPAASLIVADPALTDSLPLRPTVVAAVEGLYRTSVGRAPMPVLA